MKTIHMHALNMDVPVADKYFFFDEGYVSDLEKKEMFLCWKHKEKYEPPEIIDCGKRIGSTYVDPTKTHVYIYYLKSQDGWKDIRARAHEETHALQQMEAIQSLQEELDKRNFRVKLSDYNAEVQACIGGWYSLAAWGQEIRRRGRWINTNDEVAYRVLKNETAWYKRLARKLGID